MLGDTVLWDLLLALILKTYPGLSLLSLWRPVLSALQCALVILVVVLRSSVKITEQMWVTDPFSLRFVRLFLNFTPSPACSGQSCYWAAPTVCSGFAETGSSRNSWNLLVNVWMTCFSLPSMQGHLHCECWCVLKCVVHALLTVPQHVRSCPRTDILT